MVQAQPGAAAIGKDSPMPSKPRINQRQMRSATKFRSKWQRQKLTFIYVDIHRLSQLFRIWEGLGLILRVNLPVFIWFHNKDLERTTAI
jgi:hypothetical protein